MPTTCFGSLIEKLHEATLISMISENVVNVIFVVTLTKSAIIIIISRTDLNITVNAKDVRVSCHYSVLDLRSL